jgi:hypothetical protein
MERVPWLLDQIQQHFRTVEEFIANLMAKIPGIGDFASGHSNLIALALIALVIMVVIKPLIKWSFGIVIIGSVLAALISYFSGFAFWGILPLTALGATLIMFSNKVSVG